ncbi:hypothetical protein Pst134EA_013620 [Puccinia striiformis f. sp. tritici]|uniref:Uncharacterized protein n=1 Tax=Puccinia striiformis f. sp. tritici PST-78 TaxID=1165861 RepID=A0A0L0V1S4_9BASI|nr:hypothetical protein Pst134EA_013620 [Puccinia striiformis f. sp. tritici]KAH9465752.1 hypothetical protein Pst134EA_013620 [Puccinia striiformis f. sp. tritici]KNE93136.1 hypothetical protein PSTG_13525 [Puccinia striiformis f. sp. tritici PST-78]
MVVFAAPLAAAELPISDAPMCGPSTMETKPKRRPRPKKLDLIEPVTKASIATPLVNSPIAHPPISDNPTTVPPTIVTQPTKPKIPIRPKKVGKILPPAEVMFPDTLIPDDPTLKTQRKKRHRSHKVGPLEPLTTVVPAIQTLLLPNVGLLEKPRKTSSQNLLPPLLPSSPSSS